MASKLSTCFMVGMLTLLVNGIFHLGKLTAALKIGALTPVLKKKGSSSEAKNYRGITILPIVTKVIEKTEFNHSMKKNKTTSKLALRATLPPPPPQWTAPWFLRRWSGNTVIYESPSIWLLLMSSAHLTWSPMRACWESFSILESRVTRGPWFSPCIKMQSLSLNGTKHTQIHLKFNREFGRDGYSVQTFSSCMAMTCWIV